MTQPLNNIVNLTVEVSPTPVTPNGFNVGLIVGTSTIISTTSRTTAYANTAAMLSGGWTGTEPEYKAAQVYFAQSPTPLSLVVGRQGTASTTLSTALTSGNPYTSLSVAALTGAIANGDTLTLTSGGNTQTVTASASAASGATTISVQSFDANFSYPIGTTVSNSETPLQAVTACRASNINWYGAYVCGVVDADVEAVAGYIETAVPASTFFFDTADANVLSNTTPNVLSTLKGDNYQRTLGIYSTSQHAGAGVLGEAMGLNTSLANSSFTLAYKSLTSVTPEVLTTTQASGIASENGNIYTNYGNQYNLLTQGVMANGTSYDQVLNIDQITADIQTVVMNALTTGPKIPQTDAGVTMLVNAMTSACEQAKTRGSIAPGVWNGGQVLGLQNGTMLTNGYVILADTLANQSQADRTARKSPPIYVCIKMAGAVEHVVIGVIVNQ